MKKQIFSSKIIYFSIFLILICFSFWGIKNVGAAVPDVGDQINVDKHMDMQGHKIINLGTPEEATDVATKSYIDSIATGTGSIGLWMDGTTYIYPSNVPANSFVILDTGIVGIGTTIPVAKLEVANNYSSTENLPSANIGIVGRNFVGTGTNVIGVYGQGKTNDASYNSYGGYFYGTYSNNRNKAIGIYAYGNDYAAILDGTVGIGSSLPATKLDVNGNIQAGTYYDRDDSNYFLNPAAGGTGWGLYSNGSIYASGSDSNYFAGSVGIGITNPGAKLSIVTPDTNYLTIWSNNGGANNEYLSLYQTADDFIFTSNKNGTGVRKGIGITATGADNTMPSGIYLKTDGNVGVGTTIPGFNLDVYGSGVVASQIVSTNNYSAQYIKGGQSGDVRWGLFSGYPNVGDFTIRETGVADYLTVKKTTGYVGVGTTIPSTNLDINGQIKIRGGVPGANKILISDAVGLATWSPATSISDGDWTISGNNQYSAVSGNVGIGVTNPTANLSIMNTSGAFLNISGLPSAGTYEGIRFGGQAEYEALKGGIFFKKSTDPLYAANQRGDLIFAVNSIGDNSNVSLTDAKMTIAAAHINGAERTRVGIGTTTPTHALEVIDTTDNGGSPTFQPAGYFVQTAGSGGTGLYGEGFVRGVWGSSRAEGGAGFGVYGQIGNHSACTLDTGVGGGGAIVGVVDCSSGGSPAVRAVVATAGGGYGIFSQGTNSLNYFEGNVGIGTTNPGIDLAIGDTDTGLDWASDGNLKVMTNNSERIRITDTGKVGIGVTNPVNRLVAVSTAAEAGGITTGNLLLGQYSDGSSLIPYIQNYSGGPKLAFDTLSGEFEFTDGNVGIGITSPTTALDVSGEMNIYNPSGNELNIEGIESDASIQLHTTGNQYVIGIDHSQSILELNYGDMGSYHFVMTHAGKVGIGYSDPSGHLAVNGNVGIGTTAPGIDLAIGDTDTGLDWASDGNLKVMTNNSERIRIASDGKVGIGTTGPVSPLDVRGDGGAIALNTAARGVFSSSMTAASNGYLFGGGAGDVVPLLVASENASAINVGGGIGFAGKFNSASNTVVTLAGILGAKENATNSNDSGYLAFGTRASGDYIKERMRITSTGILRLVDNDTVIDDEQALNSIEFYTSDASGEGTGSNAKIISYADDIYGRMGLQFHTGDDGGGANQVKERIRIDFTGQVGIGTTGPSTTLDVNGGGRFRSIGSGTYTGAVNRTSDGTLTTATSDLRLKKDITQIDNALQKVLALRGVTFNWKDSNNTKRMMGMVAQEVLPIVPEIVFQNPTDGYYGINYGESSALLIEAIKQQQKEIEDLKKVVCQLKPDADVCKK